MPLIRRRWMLAGCALALLVTACSAPTAPGTDAPVDELVLGDGYEPDSLSPLLGYGTEGASKIYDGLITHDADRTLRPALAASPPEPVDGGRSWTVPLREGVTFHDGSSFEATDVVATFDAIRDPAVASTEATTYNMIEDVVAVDPRTVRFDLSFPYSAFPHLLGIGILPSEAFAEQRSAEEMSSNTEPVGTGPYRFVEWRRGERMVLAANEDYWNGAPRITRITIVFAADDNTRAQRMASGEFDGVVLPPALAHTFADRDGYRVIMHRSADYRGITLPRDNPVTSDDAIRLALNHAVNRQGMIDGLLAGEGEPAHTPIPQQLGDDADPAATFDFDLAQAENILAEAGWRTGPDGVRRREGQRAEFTLMYNAEDSVRRDLAQAVASDAGAVGIRVNLEGLGWEAIEPRMAADAVVLGGGNPMDPDLTSYPLLHSSFGGDGFNNPGYYENPDVDAALDRGRTAGDHASRRQAYRDFQRAYVADPGMVFLVFLNHAYVTRGDPAPEYEPVVEPHAHGVHWGPWWNVEQWTVTE